MAGALPVDGSPTECPVRSPTATAETEACFLMHPFHQLLPSSRLYCSPMGRGRKSYSVCVSRTQGNRQAVGLCGEGPLHSGPQAMASVPALSRCAALGGGHSAFTSCHPPLPDLRFPALCQEVLSGSSATVSTQRPLRLQRPILCCLRPDTTLAAAEGGVGLGRCPRSPHREGPRHLGLSPSPWARSRTQGTLRRRQCFVPFYSKE